MSEGRGRGLVERGEGMEGRASMKPGDLIAGAFLALMVLFMFMFSDRGDNEVGSFNARVDAQDKKIGLLSARTIPQVTVQGRASIYTGDGELIIQQVEK